MKEYNDNFELSHANDSKNPLYTIELSFDTGFTDLVYFTSSTNAQHPVSATVYDSTVKNFTSISQKIDPIKFISSIGSINFELNDNDGSITSLLKTKLDSGFGVRKKRVRIYIGYEELDWSDYEIIQTQIISSDVIYDGGSLKFSCSDVNRIIKKDIFDLAKTTLSSTLEIPPEASLTVAITNPTTWPVITVNDATGFASNGAILIGNEIIDYGSVTLNGAGIDDTFNGCTKGTNNTTGTTHLIGSSVSQTMYTVNVYNTDDFEANEHDAEYSDEPNQTVYYFRINKEVLRCTGKTSTTFTSVFRGALNTKPEKHDVDSGKGADKRPAVEEYVYIQTNVIKVIYGLLLGIWHNNPTSASLPSKWGLNIDTIWIRNSDFTNIQADLWNNLTANVNTGPPVYIEGVKKQDGKRFIEKELLPLVGCFLPIYAEGDIGIHRMTGVSSKSGYVYELNASNIHQDANLALTHDMNSVANQFEVDWNWSSLKEKFTRPTTFIDLGSISTHQDANPIKLKFRALSGSAHTESTIRRILERLRDRNAAPPARLNLRCLPSTSVLEVGDVVRVNYDKIRDFTSDSEALDRSFEVQQISTNYITGDTDISLFGSTVKADTAALTALGSVLEDSFYSSFTENISGLFGYVLGALTANVTMAGGATLDAGVWYHDGDLEIVTGVTVTITNNVRLVVKGHLTINGKIDGASQGFAGATAPSSPTEVWDVNYGTKGFLSTLRGGGGIDVNHRETSTSKISYAFAYRGRVTDGYDEDYRSKWSVPVFELTTDGTTISGLPTVVAGSSGASGTNTAYSFFYAPTNTRTVYGIVAGGNGGPGGAGIQIISRGGSYGVNGSVDLSGGDGSVGSSRYDAFLVNSGGGGGGAPGVLHWVLDGALVSIPDTGKLTANYGIAPITGTPMPKESYRGFFSEIDSYPSGAYSYHTGITSPKDVGVSAYRAQFVSDYASEGDEDYDYLPKGPTNLSATSGTDDLLTLGDGTIISRIRLTWTASTNQDIDRYLITFAKSDEALDSHAMIDLPSRDATEAYIYPVVDGALYYIRLLSINKFGEASHSVYHIHTVTGKTAAPSDPTSVTVRADPIGARVEWLNPDDKDLSTIEIYMSSANTIPNNPIYRIKATKPSANQYYTIPLYEGSHKYFWLKAVDSTGNSSGSVATTPTNYKRSLPLITNPINTFRQDNKPLGTDGDIWHETLTSIAYRNDGTLDPVEFTTALTASDLGAGDEFGRSVSLSKDGLILAVGASKWDDTYSNQGCVYIFDWNGDSWNERSQITASDEWINDNFGNGVAISGDGAILAVTATGADKAYVFDWNGVQWDERIITSPIASVDFGADAGISKDGTIIAIGGTSYLGKGGVYVYDWDGIEWSLRATVVTGSDSTSGDLFGAAVSLSSDGSIMAVGAQYWDDTYTDQGCVYIFDWNGSSWTERAAILTASNASSSDYFGITVGLSSDGNTLIVGAIGAKSAYIFDWGGSSWTERSTILTASDEGPGDAFGTGVALSGDSAILAVGAVGWDSVSNEGAVYIFNTPWKVISDITSNNQRFTFSDDLVIDGDAEEEGITYWNYGGVVEKSTADKYFGLQSIKITGLTSTVTEQTTANGNRLYIPVHDDDTFTIKYWGKRISGSSTIGVYISCYDGNKTLIGLYAATTASTTWGKVTVAGQVVTAGTRYITIGLKSTSSSAGYVDAIFVKRE